MDYVICDQIACPSNMDSFYSEKIIRLVTSANLWRVCVFGTANFFSPFVKNQPHTYFLPPALTDTNIPKDIATLSEPSSVHFCCLNHLGKLDYETFAAWLKVFFSRAKAHAANLLGTRFWPLFPSLRFCF
jgi:predicted O-linked N-acetylglucosamine transferase (SPINDLY family)